MNPAIKIALKDRKRMLGMLRNCGLDPNTAEDVYQTGLERLVRSPPADEGRSQSAYRWYAIQTIRRCIPGVLKDMGMQVEETGGDYIETCPELMLTFGQLFEDRLRECESPETVLCALAEVDESLELLSKCLSPDHYEAFCMVTVDGLSLPVVSEITGFSVVNLRKIVSRARAYLREED